MNILTPTVLNNSIFTSSYGGKSLLFNVQKDEKNQELVQSWENRQEGYMSGPIVLGCSLPSQLCAQLEFCVGVVRHRALCVIDLVGRFVQQALVGALVEALNSFGQTSRPIGRAVLLQIFSKCLLEIPHI